MKITNIHMEELLIMDYQKEYANLVGQIDRAISILEHYAPGDPIVRCSATKFLRNSDSENEKK